MPSDLPSGTVTFLFTDIEGSTKLMHELGPETYAEALAEHRRVLRDVSPHTAASRSIPRGMPFFIAFPTAPGAVAAASEGLAALAPGPIRVRMGLHTGSPHQLPRSSWPRERRGALALALGQDTKGDSMQSCCFTLDLKV